jgi:hypothetical protein
MTWAIELAFVALAEVPFEDVSGVVVFVDGSGVVSFD